MKPYYEGWYMKQQQGGEVLAVIPGRAQDSAFVQVVTNRGSRFVPYPLEAFDHRGNSMRVGGSLFTTHGMDLRIDEPGFEITGTVRYHDLLPLRSDIMGPFAHLPMETKHTVFSMRHRVTGCVHINGDAMELRDGVGYMEGDRGHTFPNSYFWMQCLDEQRDASIMLAIAEIPLGPVRFTGCIGVVTIGSEEHRFATYRGVRFVRRTPTLAEVRQGDMSLLVEVLDDRGHALQAPMQGMMDRTIHESPAVPARFRFVKRGETLLEGTSLQASYEFVPPAPASDPASAIA